MRQVLTSFVENFLSDVTNDDTRQWTDEDGKQVIASVKAYVDKLQNIVFDGLFDDCVDIINKYRKFGNELETVSSWSKFIQSDESQKRTSGQS